MYDVIIIGAGASGCFLALTLKYKNPNLKVALIEKNDKLGKKLLITGNGRCNLGNTNINIDNYNSSSSLEKFANSLQKNEYLNCLKKFGILIKKEDTSTRLYPYSNQAITVCKSFERALENENVKLIYNYDVKKATYENSSFVLNNDLKCKKLVVATGGKTYIKTESKDNGYNILKSFGHTITKLYPALTFLKTDHKYIKDLQGVRANVVVSLSVDGSVLKKEEGQVQFTKYTLSGICIFNLSRDVNKYLKDNKKVEIVVDLVPDYNRAYIECYLKEFSDYNVVDAISCILNKKIAQVVSNTLKLPDKKISGLSKSELENISYALKNMHFNIIETGDFKAAQVTNGGAKLDEFTSGLESLKKPLLYAIGEVLDVDGKCGGYNLSWAFNSALIAAEDILKK